MAWYDDLEGTANRILDRVDRYERGRRDEKIARRRRMALYAMPLHRMVALLIDVCLIFFLLGTVFAFVERFLPALDVEQAVLFLQQGMRGVSEGRISSAMFLEELSRRGYVQQFLLSQGAQILMLALVVVPMLWRWQATPGMFLTRLRLYRADRVSKPGFLRCLGFFLAGTGTLMSGYLIVIFMPDRRALHDIMSGTAILRRKEIKEREAAAALLAADEAAEAQILAQAQARMQAAE